MLVKNLYDYIDVIELKEMYRLIFQDDQLDMIRDRDEMYRRLEAFAPGEGEGYLRFMNDTKRKMDQLTHHYLRPKVLKALPQLSLNKSLYDVLSDYFSNESVKYAFTFQSKYLGMSPWECPGAFSILSFMEHDTGVFHPKGGVNQLSEAMAKVAVEAGATIHLSAGVEKLLTEGRKVKGICLESGEELQADEVVVNGEFAHVMTKLVEPGLLKKYSEKKLKKKKFSCSTFMLYLKKAGHDVTLVEKNERLGGRLAFVREKGYKVDEGPTIVLLPDMLKGILHEVGMDEASLDLLQLDPLYTIQYQDGTSYTKYSDAFRQLEEIRRVFPKEDQGFLRFMEEMTDRFQEGQQAFLEISFHEKRTFFTKANMKILMKLKAYRTVQSALKKYFSDERLRDAYALQTLYVGGNPYEASAIYSLVSYSEHAHGIYYLKGGYASLVDILERQLIKMGVHVRKNEEVTELEFGGSAWLEQKSVPTI